MRRLLALSLLLLLLTGALGLRTPAECANLVRDSHKIQCYHSAALTIAYLGDSSAATGVCDSIWDNYGSGRSKDDDLKKKAELVSNSCYHDVAKIARDPNICGFIQQRENFNTKLFGYSVTQDICFNETARLAKIQPHNYYRNPNNLCAMIFVLPLFVFSIMAVKNQKGKNTTKGYPLSQGLS
jgi:hypothetical protein